MQESFTRYETREEIKAEMKADWEEMLAKMDTHHVRLESNNEEMMAKVMSIMNAWKPV
jgi:hypothetical protein